MVRFVPVQDPERPRAEQDEESLRVHRKFDAPHAVLPTDLNNPSHGSKDRGDDVLAKPSGKMAKDEKSLWRQKQELFKRETKFGEGKETTQFQNPEAARADGEPQQRRSPYGPFEGHIQTASLGGRGSDNGYDVVQRGEVDQRMVLNEKGLWVRAKSGAGDRSEAAANNAAAKLRQAPPGEDPRCEAAGKRKSQEAGSSERALAAMRERRERQMKERLRMGEAMADSMSRVLDKQGSARGSQQCVAPAQRTAGGEAGRIKRFQEKERRIKEDAQEPSSRPGASREASPDTARSRSPGRRPAARRGPQEDGSGAAPTRRSDGGSDGCVEVDFF